MKGNTPRVSRTSRCLISLRKICAIDRRQNAKRGRPAPNKGAISMKCGSEISLQKNSHWVSIFFTIYYRTYWTLKYKHRNERLCSGENNHIRATMLILVVLSHISFFSIIQSEIRECKISKNSFSGTDKTRSLEIHVFIWEIRPDRNSRFFHIYVTCKKITGTYNNNKKFIKETKCRNREHSI